jgi:hypothetical protein
MNKRELALLEKVFAEEINPERSGFPPVFQTKSKIAKKLEEEGMLQSVEYQVGHPFSLKVKGYVLTEAGRYEYCKSCSDEPEND